MAGFGRRAGRALLDLVYPPLCLNCESAVAEADALCGRCFARLRRSVRLLSGAGPAVQGLSRAGRAVGQAIADPPPFRRARSAVVYNEVARKLVARLKYGDRPELARFCGRLMARAGRDLFAEAPVVVPVPLHRSRHFVRRYNQSAELARVVGRIAGLAVDTGLARRTRRTRQQVGLSADARERNVAGAFAIHPQALLRLRGRGVLLVDDVVTTGSTVRALTRAFRRAGVEHVDVLSFARVVTGSDLP